MESTKVSASGSGELNTERDQAIQQFLDRFGSEQNNDLLADMMVSICRLSRTTVAVGS